MALLYMPVYTQKETVAVGYNKIAAMIVVFSRTPVYTKMSPHGEGGEPWWISAGALQHLYENTDYTPYFREPIYEHLINWFNISGHLRTLAVSPFPVTSLTLPTKRTC